MFREQLVHLINKTDGMKVCGEADNIRDAFALIQQLRPSIAIVDITLSKGSSGLELLKDLRAQGVAVPAGCFRCTMNHFMRSARYAPAPGGT